MYTPQAYKHDNLEDIKAFIKNHSFGILLNHSGDKMLGTHIPLELDLDENENDILFGHISKANQQFDSLKNGSDVLAIFSGPNAYVSSSWYQKADAPTWNYIAVHVYGKIRLIDDKTLMQCLGKLITKYEQTSEQPISLQDMPTKTLKQVQGILGFYIEITSIEATYKLSQDKNETDQKNIIKRLSEKQQKTKSKTIVDYMRSLKLG